MAPMLREVEVGGVAVGEDGGGGRGGGDGGRHFSGWSR